VPGLLIVNADDFGGNALATDRIVKCFEAAAITSASAMVYMPDSRRAAALAGSHSLPIGLHLNLTQEFEDPSTPPTVRERQARAVSYFASARRRRFTYNPFKSLLVKECVADQIECFRELFDAEPTHIDGHNHAHLSPTALFALPRELPVRTAQSRRDGTATTQTRLGSVRHKLIAHRQPTTDCFFAIDTLGASPTDTDIDDLLGLAERASVEIMTHPDRDRDHRLLMSDAWRSALHRRTLGSFAQLTRTRA
jgi:predicted glycoside hydrolase/deacetylase ChbG (UPF0249 family)